MIEYKLYILIRRDISPEQQAVQAGHAVAQFLKDNPKTKWSNGTLIYLSVKDDTSLGLWWNIISYMNDNKHDVKCGMFKEPDMDDQVTAMYVYGICAEFLLRDLPLMRFS